VEVLLFTVGAQSCALPLSDVAEVMRAQPLASQGLQTPGVLGTSLIRGRPTPVVDAGQLL
jgi:chemotaxis signal transduction protein